MKSIKQMLMYGFLVWLIPFVIAFLIFPIHESNRILFESIMPVGLTISVVLFANLYFRTVTKKFLQEGFVLGIVWLAINIVIDLLFFMQGPMKMPFSQYVMDIGLTYIMIPVITTGFGYLIENRQKEKGHQ